MARRIAFSLPDWHEKYLILWADCKGVSMSGLANNALQARIEANQDQIESMIRDRAGDLGISPADLKNRILHGTYSPSDE